MKNVQISFDEKLLSMMDRIAASSNLTRSALVREALKDWIREREARQFEQEWIAKLKKQQPEPDDLDEWIQAEEWGDR